MTARVFLNFVWDLVPDEDRSKFDDPVEQRRHRAKQLAALGGDVRLTGGG